MAEGEVPTAAEVQKALGGMEYPANKKSVVKHAREHEADTRVMNFLERIPDREYGRATDISHELGEYSHYREEP